MNVIEQLVQGTPEWHAHRAQHFNASDAPAMMGCSPYETRAALLRRLHTGIANEHDAGTQRLFANGHRYEALARPLAERIIDEPLDAITVTNGRLSASLDGATLDGQILFEHKTLTAELRALLAPEGMTPGSALPLHYRVQMEQQLHCSGGDRVLFMASKWSDDDELIEERHCWYTGDMALRQQIIQGWQQFEADLVDYVPPEAAERVTAEAQDHLPAVSVRVDGRLAVVSNLAVFKDALAAYIGKVPTKPSTDQEFANAEAACKTLKTVEERLQATEDNALASMADVETMRRLVAECRDMARTTRLATEKMVKARKDAIREEEVQRGKKALLAHIDACNRRLGGTYIAYPFDNFASAIKGLKTIDSVRNAIDTELAQRKIECSALADKIDANGKTIDAAGSPHLFGDRATLVEKAPDDLAAVIANRLAAEQQRLDAERERIRAEEAARLEREQRLAATAPIAAAMVTPPPPPFVATRDDDGKMRVKYEDQVAADIHGRTVDQLPPLGPPTLTLGTIQDRLGFTIHADFLTRLGFPYTPVKAAKLYHASDFGRMCAKLAEHVLRVGEEHP